ncbi:hypothetical protein BY996DRAFT_6416136 [Phakopsora pachyrhizi]|nr:hypothetical protein BY996DRAFT_6416136 [Phakopsora pachyrhizi]
MSLAAFLHINYTKVCCKRTAHPIPCVTYCAAAAAAQLATSSGKALRPYYKLQDPNLAGAPKAVSQAISLAAAASRKHTTLRTSLQKSSRPPNYYLPQGESPEACYT